MLKKILIILCVLQVIAWCFSAKFSDVYKKYLISSSFVAGSFLVDGDQKNKNQQSVEKFNQAALHWRGSTAKKALLPISGEHNQFAWRPIIILPDVFGHLSRNGISGLAKSTFFGCIIYLNYDELKEYSTFFTNSHEYIESTLHHEILHCYDYRHSPDKGSVMYWGTTNRQRHSSYVDYVLDIIRIDRSITMSWLFGEEKENDEN